MMMLPGTTDSPPNFLTPRRRPAVSRPLREEPPAFLCAIGYSPYSLSALGAAFLAAGLSAVSAAAFFGAAFLAGALASAAGASAAGAAFLAGAFLAAGAAFGASVTDA